MNSEVSPSTINKLGKNRIISVFEFRFVLKKINNFPCVGNERSNGELVKFYHCMNEENAKCGK